MTKLPYNEFKHMIMDPNVPDKEIGLYLSVDRERGGPFDPRLAPDPAKVDLGQEGRFDTENAMRWANGICLWRRERRFEQRRSAGETLPVLVSEGDSWFQFPFIIDDVIDHLGQDHLVWSLDAAGDTAENMVNRRPEYMKALVERRRDNVGAFLFSAAGNDVIGEDEFGEPVLKALLKEHDPDKDAAWHIDQARLAHVLRTLETSYRKMIATVRAVDGFKDLPILIHGYDYPLPGGQVGDERAPFWAARDEWLGGPMAEKGINDHAKQCAIVRLLIDALYDTLAIIAGNSQSTRVYLVDVRGTLASTSDWADEIHGTDVGFARIADRFRAKLQDAGVGSG
jgi:hypothetical protein